jgi:PAS domain S-box-containing protein
MAYSLFGLALLTAFTYICLHVLGREHPLLYAILALFYVMLMLGCAWTGYLPGLAVCALSIWVVPYLLGTRARGGEPDFVRFALIAVISLLVSYIGSVSRRREAELRRAAAELEERVRLRTAEATEAAAALREQAQLLDLAHDAIFSATGDGTILFWNHGAAEMYGWTRDEATGQVSHDLLHTVFPEPLAEVIRHLNAEGHWEGELIHTCRDGSTITVASRWAPRQGPKGEYRGFLEINTDITEHKKIEDQLRHTQKLESLGVLAGGVAHDFNNLLTGILGNANLALDATPAHHPNRVLIEEVMLAAERAADLTRQLLAYAGKGRFIMRTVDLSTLVREISGLVQTSIPKPVQLRLQLAENLPGIYGDPGQLQQIVMNLVINGAEAIGPGGGTVLVRTEEQNLDEPDIARILGPSPVEPLKPGRFVALEVRDTGCGMAPETLPRIFDPFFSTKFAGRGLGLSAVSGIVRSHHGALQVSSRQGHGTTFKVLLPASSAAGREVPVDSARDLTGHGKILVVDDEEIVRQTARNALERFGYEVVLAADGAQAVETFGRETGVSLVLLDLTMPVMGGEEALQRLRQIDPSVRVLLSSGYNEAEAVERFADKGLAGFMQKPYTAVALAEKVKSALAG